MLLLQVPWLFALGVGVDAPRDSAGDGCGVIFPEVCISGVGDEATFDKDGGRVGFTEDVEAAFRRGAGTVRTGLYMVGAARKEFAERPGNGFGKVFPLYGVGTGAVVVISPVMADMRPTG